jgi:hypothetical protein
VRTHITAFEHVRVEPQLERERQGFEPDGAGAYDGERMAGDFGQAGSRARGKGGRASIAACRTALTLTLLSPLAGSACGPRRDPTELAVALPADVEQGLSLTWERVSGADSYKLRFLRMTGAPVCSLSVDAAPHPGFVMRRDSLPDGLTSGRELLVEVRAMRHGTPMPRVGVRPLQIP